MYSFKLVSMSIYWYYFEKLTLNNHYLICDKIWPTYHMSKHFNSKNRSLPMQGWVLQATDWISGPNFLQSFPPCCGFGSLHSRLLVFTPPLQDFVHVVYALQSPYLPWTALKVINFNKTSRFKLWKINFRNLIEKGATRTKYLIQFQKQI